MLSVPQIADPRTWRKRREVNDVLAEKGIIEIREQLDILETMIAVVEESIKRLSSPDAQWFLNTFLSAETHRLEHERSFLDPTNTAQQCTVKGQIDEIFILQNRLEDATNELQKMQRDRSLLNAAVERWAKKQAERNRGKG